MARRIDAETRAQIVEKYLADESLKYTDIAREFGCSAAYVGRIIKNELQAGSGVKPDRRAEPDNPWMEHITPLHRHKMELEQQIEHKQAELDKAKQALRDFTATLRQLLKEEV